MTSAVVVGIGSLPFAKDLGMTERRAGALAIRAALAEAGLTPAETPGLDPTPSGAVDPSTVS